jgi:chromosome segregation ATPase
MSTLSDKISLLLQQAEATSEALAGIIDNARSELEVVKEARDDAKARMLDPSSGSATVTKAKRELDDSTLAASRLEAAIAHLADHLEAAREREAETARVQRYDEALTERDRLAQEILEKYPEAAATIASLLMQMAVVDEKVAAANQDLPADAPYLDTVGSMTQISGGWDLSRVVRLPAIAAVGIPDHVRTHPAQTQIWPAGRQ